MTNNFFETIITYAERFPDRAALNQWTYRELVQAVHEKCAGLKKLGLPPQSRVGVLIRPNLEFYALTVACFALGLVPVLFDPKTTAVPSGLAACEGKLSWWKLLLTQKLFKIFARRSESVQSDDYYFYNAKDLVFSHIDSEGQVLNVSYQSHNAQVRLYATALRSQESEIDVVFSPLLVLQNLRQGLTSLLGSDKFSVEFIRNQPVTRLKGCTQQLIDLGKTLKAQNISLPLLHSIFVEGQKLCRKDASHIEFLFPKADIYHCFGISEIEPLAVISISDIRKSPTVGYVVGHALDTVHLEIVKPDVDLAEKNVKKSRVQEGEVIISAPHLAEHPTLPSFTDDEGTTWLHTGILGYFGPDRNLYLLGHLAEQIQIGPRKYPVELLEQQFETIPGVEKVSLVRSSSEAHLFVTISPEIPDAEAVSAVIEKYGIDFKLGNLRIHSKKEKLAVMQELPQVK
jgi:acyl-CoA synthetase (AMP-forming)/AMP-acid ligase II